MATQGDELIITGDGLRLARRTARITQQLLADRLGVSLRTIGYWERPGGRVPVRYRDAVARMLPGAAPASCPPGEPHPKAANTDRLATASVQLLERQRGPLRPEHLELTVWPVDNDSSSGTAGGGSVELTVNEALRLVINGPTRLSIKMHNPRHNDSPSLDDSDHISIGDQS